VGCNFSRHRIGKSVAVDGKRATGRHLAAIGTGHDQGTGEAHFRMDHADGVRRRIIGAEGIGADELGQAVGLVGIGTAHAAHLV